MEKNKYNFDNDLHIKQLSLMNIFHEQVFNALKKYVKVDIARSSLPGWDGFTDVLLTNMMNH